MDIIVSPAIDTQLFPHGTVAGSWILSMDGEDIAVYEQLPAQVPVTANPGSHVLNLRRMDAAGGVLKDVDAPFVVPYPPVGIEVPIAINITFP